LATEIEVGQAFVDRLPGAHVRGEDVVTEVSMAKWWTTDLQQRVAARCLQLHGGYGFMREYPISQDYADAAVQSIYAGTNEIMKRIIAQRLGLGGARARGPPSAARRHGTPLAPPGSEPKPRRSPMIRSTLAGIAALTLAALPVAAQAQPRAQSRA